MTSNENLREAFPLPGLKKKIERVLLISPPGKMVVTRDGARERKLAVPPLGVASMAAALRQQCPYIHVEILDVMIEGYDNERAEGIEILYGLDNDQVAARIEAFKPDMVGVSCLFSNRGKEAVGLCEVAKKTVPDAHVVMGGQHPSGMPQLVLNESIDYILYGEADNSLPRLIETINTGGDITAVSQIVLADGDSYWKSEENDYPDPSSLPFPALDIIGLDKYWAASAPDFEANDYKKFVMMLTSRGCPHACYYCTAPFMSDKRYRRKEVPEILDEIQFYIDTYGAEEIHFWDDNFFINKKRTKDLLRELARNFKEISFQVPSGTEINALDDEIIDLLKEAGFIKMSLAIESMNPEIQQNNIENKVNLDRVPDVVRKLRNHGIITEGSFMVGFPGESKKQIDHTFETATKLGLDGIHISVVNPLPGTPLYDECVEKNILSDDFDPQDIRFSSENIKMPDVEKGYMSKRRRDVWLEYMSKRVDVEEYESQAGYDNEIRAAKGGVRRKNSGS